MKQTRTPIPLTTSAALSEKKKKRDQSKGRGFGPLTPDQPSGNSGVCLECTLLRLYACLHECLDHCFDSLPTSPHQEISILFPGSREASSP